MSPPLKELCFFFMKIISHDFKNGFFLIIAFNVHVVI